MRGGSGGFMFVFVSELLFSLWFSFSLWFWISFLDPLGFRFFDMDGCVCADFGNREND